MSRLMAFGCSNTQGCGLPGYERHEDPYWARPSNYAWPTYLAEKMNLECNNFGHGGASNKLILNKMLETALSKNDCVVILWTEFARHHILNQNTYATRLIPSDSVRSRKMAKWMRNKQKTRFSPKDTKLYFEKFYNDEDSFWENLVKINFAKFVLDSREIENYHFLWNVHAIDTLDYPYWNRVNFKHLDFDPAHGFADDELHPSMVAQQKAAEDIFQHIVQTRNILK